MNRIFPGLAALVVAFAINLSSSNAQTIMNGAVGNGANVTSVHHGVFARCCSAPPYGVDATSGASAAPSPYPTYTGNLNAFCSGPDASGNSILSYNPLDATKMKNIYDIGADWVRQEDAPYFIDQSAVFGAGMYQWQYVDAVLCELSLHHIQPAIALEIGPREYNDSVGGFTIVAHNRYDTPTQYAAYCSAMATRASTIFGDHLYTIPANELNGDAGATDGQDIINGAPPPPVVIAVSGGSLSTSTAENYEITPMIGGVEGIPSAPYYSNVTPASGKQSLQITWGPSAAETGGYKIYRLTSGSYKYLTAVAHGVTTYTDTGSITPTSATPPTTSIVTVAAFEADIAAYTSDCYTAIKVADPQSFIFGFELNESTGLTPTPAQFISDEVGLGCGPGTCYDGLSTHLAPPYPMPGLSTTCLSEGGAAYSLACLQALETAAGTPVPLMIGEYTVTVPGVVSTEATAALAITQGENELASYPYVRYINYANLDECALYGSGFYYGGCAIGEPTGANNNRALRWQSLQSIYSTATGAAGNGTQQP